MINKKTKWGKPASRQDLLGKNLNIIKNYQEHNMSTKKQISGFKGKSQEAFQAKVSHIHLKFQEQIQILLIILFDL